MTPTENTTLAQRRADFANLAEGLDYAARGKTGVNFYAGRGELLAALSYAELREGAIEMARGLIAAGIEPGSRIVLLADTTPDFVTLFFACQYASIVPVPVALPTTIGGRDSYVETVRRQLRASGAVAAMAPAELQGYLKEAAEGLSLRFAGAPADFHALPPGGADPRPFGADEPCYLQFSSGSTRWPQAIEIPQRALMANCRAIAQSGLDVRPQDRCASWLPLYHDMGLVGFLLTAVLTQLSVDYLATRDFARRPLLWLSLITRNRATLSYSPSFGYDLCTRRARDGGSEPLDLTSWRVAGIGGDMVQPHLLERFAEAFAACGFRKQAFLPSYGLAEATLAVSFAARERGLEVDRVDRRRLGQEHRAVPAANGADRAARDFVLCGQPLPEHRIEVRDERGGTLGERRVGRIFVRGPSVMAGYFGEPDATARVLADGWLDTGDLGYTIGGALVITGREKDLIIVNGRNIWPQDLEWAVEELPQLRRGDVAAFSVDEDEAEQVILLIQCRVAGAQVRAELVREIKALVRRLAGIECEIVLVPPRALPQTSSGKLSRSRAKRLYLDGAFGERPNAERGASMETSPAPGLSAPAGLGK